MNVCRGLLDIHTRFTEIDYNKCKRLKIIKAHLNLNHVLVAIVRNFRFYLDCTTIGVCVFVVISYCSYEIHVNNDYNVFIDI